MCDVRMYRWPAVVYVSFLQVREIAKDYYKRIEPRDAAVLVKQLNASFDGGG